MWGAAPAGELREGANTTSISSDPLRFVVTTPARAPSLTPVDSAGSADRYIPHSVLRDVNGRLAQDIPPREIRDAIADPATRLWVDIDSTSRHQHAILEKLFRFHPLTVEDTLNPHSRV